MKHLPGLVPPVGQYAVLNIRLFQKRGIDERHTPAKEEEEEQVAGEFKIWLLREVEVSDAFDVSDRYGPLEGLLRSGEHRAEGPAVVGQPLLDGSVVNGPEDAHVKGYGVGGDFCRSQVSLIILHEDRVYRRQRDVLAVPEPLETAQCRTVVPNRAHVFQLQEPFNDTFREVEKGVLPSGMPELRHHVVRRVAALQAVEALYNSTQPFHIRIQFLDCRLHDGSPESIVCRDWHGVFPVPFMGKYVVSGNNPSCGPEARYRKNGSARTIFECRRAGFYFFGSHTSILLFF